MKKFGISILFFIAFIIIYLLQANLFPNLKILGVMPNLFVILILWIGLFASTFEAVVFGIIMGLERLKRCTSYEHSRNLYPVVNGNHHADPVP